MAYPGALRAVLTRASERALKRAGDLAEAKAKELAPKDTGYLAASIYQDFHPGSIETMSMEIVAGADYSLAVEKGTGIYGPRGRPITPKTKKVMRFPTAGKIVFAKRVSGQRGQHFMSRALRGYSRYNRGGPGRGGTR